MKNWYVLSFTANKFGAVERFLKLKKIEFFCPMLERIYARHDKGLSLRKTLIPAFPGYLFVYVDFNEIHPENLSCFTYIYGLITFGIAPMPVPNLTVKAIAEACSVIKNDSLAKKIMPQKFAAILLTEEPEKRSVMLLKYLSTKQLKLSKEVKHVS